MKETMGRRVMGLVFVLLCFTIATPSALRQVMATESNYQKTRTEKYSKDGITNQIGTRYSARTVSRRVGRGSAAGGDGGGGSRPHTGGGSVIPVYAAGSAARHRQGQGQRRNAGNRCENTMGFFIAAILASIAHLHRVF